MKFFSITTFLLLLYIVGNGQDLEESCIQAIERAKNDFEKGEMRAIGYGLPVFDQSYQFEMFYDNYLKENYNVLSYNGGCVITEASKCYSSKMFELIKLKFGNDFFERTRKEALEIYEPELFTMTVIDPNFEYEIIDSVYTLAEVQPEYPGGFEKMYDYVKKELNQPEQDKRVFISFVVNKRGIIENVKIVKGNANPVEQTIVEIVNSLPKWNAGIVDGKKVDVQMIFPFKY